MVLNKRYMVVMKAKQALVTWLNTLLATIEFPLTKTSIQLSDVENNSTLYLLPDRIKSIEECSQFIQENADDILKHELERFITDENYWPDNRDFALLSEWFEFQVYERMIV